MFPGQLTLCLKASKERLEEMRRFYEALGMRVHIDRPSYVVLDNGDVSIALMTWLEEDCLNFRGADVSEIYRRACQRPGLSFEGQPQRYGDGPAAGECWNTHDPDGNCLFFDTNEQERGEAGRALALQRVLDAAAKQLVNVSAPAECRETYRTQVLERFVPAEQRARLPDDMDTSSLTEPGAFAGHFSLCVKSVEPEASRDFYEAVGLPVKGPREGGWIQLDNGDCHIDLMSFLSANLLNFRGGDVFALHERLTASGWELEGEPARYTKEEMGAPGAHWRTKDPGGNLIYFDTTEAERIDAFPAKALRRVLERTRRQLDAIGADAACRAAFESEMTRFAS